MLHSVACGVVGLMNLYLPRVTGGKELAGDLKDGGSVPESGRSP